MKYDHKIISIGINAFKSNDYLKDDSLEECTL